MAHIRRILMPAATAAVLTVTAGCTGTSESSTPNIVVTHEVLASVVRQLVGTDATVTVMMPNGKDPHDFRPSARDIAVLDDADLVVVNGAGFETTLERSLDEARANGTEVFDVSEHLTLRTSKGVADPHYFIDPESMLQMIPELAAVLAGVVPNIDTVRVNKMVTEIKNADTQARAELSVLDADDCRFVTGHDSLGYFADRYDCIIIGALVDSHSHDAETSAEHVVDLLKAARNAGVRALFVEEGTPDSTAKTVANDLDVKIVELLTHSVPENGDYSDYVSSIARTIAQALKK